MVPDGIRRGTAGTTGVKKGWHRRKIVKKGEGFRDEDFLIGVTTFPFLEDRQPSDDTRSTGFLHWSTLLGQLRGETSMPLT